MSVRRWAPGSAPSSRFRSSAVLSRGAGGVFGVPAVSGAGGAAGRRPLCVRPPRRASGARGLVSLLLPFLPFALLLSSGSPVPPLFRGLVAWCSPSGRSGRPRLSAQLPLARPARRLSPPLPLLHNIIKT